MEVLSRRASAAQPFTDLRRNGAALVGIDRDRVPHAVFLDLANIPAPDWLRLWPKVHF
ncbi:hypothetical protein QA649_01715 [Bradyrhizobium sp. CB1717]|uniref:hypothetical protein n=1 Tax=Bradyrhizobium sp. CB1717 TaxID=3039154 RepID=UPI0024B08D3B|nr:hypothetical protein [Bradyrhizobium sp. CB1717]WFU24993.1 hypothetical protein QA649_01715 [Bradyrhizobium sp. CB1717]